MERHLSDMAVWRVVQLAAGRSGRCQPGCDPFHRRHLPPTREYPIRVA